MRIPKSPSAGHVIAYEYLWWSKHHVRSDAEKTYPATVLLARRDLGPSPLCYVLGISHKVPSAHERALEIPRKLKRHLGLDEAPSWLYTGEVNVFVWPGPDLRPAEWLSNLPSARGTCVIGALPTDWFATVVRHFQESFDLRPVNVVKRTE